MASSRGDASRVPRAMEGVVGMSPSRPAVRANRATFSVPTSCANRTAGTLRESARASRAVIRPRNSSS